MDQRLLITLGVVVVLLLAGCSMIGPNEPAFETSVAGEETSELTVGEPYEATVTVKNTGGAGGNQTITFTAAGESRNRTVALEPEKSVSLTFSHTFNKTGEYEITVDAGDSTMDVATVSVINPLASAKTAMNTTDSYVAKGQLNMSQSSSYYNYTINSTSDITVDVSTGEIHSRMDVNMEQKERSLSGVSETWNTGEYVYVRTTNRTDGEEVQYSVHSADEERVGPPVNVTGLLSQFDPTPAETTETHYVYRASPDSAEQTSAFLDHIHGLVGTYGPSDVENSNATFEVKINKETHRLSSVRVDSHSNNTGSLDSTSRMNATITFEQYNTAEEVTVPDGVLNNVPPANVYISEYNGVTVYVSSMPLAEEIMVTVNGTETARLRSSEESTTLRDVSDGATIEVHAVHSDGSVTKLETHTVGGTNTEE